MKLFFTHKPLAMQNNRIVAESYQKLIRRDERIRKTVGITGFFEFFELFPLDGADGHQAHFLNLMSKTVDKSKVFDLQVKKS